MRVLYIFTFMYSLEIWDKTGTLEKELRIFKDLHDKHKISFTFLTYGTVNDNKYSLEKTIPENIMQQLRNIGHNATYSEEPHGGGQAIFIDTKNGALIAGSDPRKDGCALGY